MTLRQGGGTPPHSPYQKPQYQQGPGKTANQQGGHRKPDAGRPGAGLSRKLLGPPRPGPARWVLAVAIFGAVMAASLGLKGVIHDFGWFPRAAVVVAATLLLPAILRRHPGLSPYAPLGALAGWIMGLTLMFFPATAVLGFIPTAGTFSAAMDLASEASSVIMGSVTPAPSVPPMFFLISAGLGFTALLIDTLAITVAMPAASSLGLVLVMLPSALMTKSGLDATGFIGAAAGFLLVLGCCRWYAPDGKLRTETSPLASGTLPRAAALGGAVVLLMLFVPAVVPGFNQGAFPQGTRLDTQEGPAGLDPMISLGTDLREPSGRVHITYLSNTSTSQYLRLNTLEDFTGKSWRPSPLPTGLPPGLEGLAPAQGASPSIPRTNIYTWITPEGLRSDWLPAPAGVTAVDELGGNWRWNPATATIKGAGSTTDGKSYVVHSSVPDLTAAELSRATGKPRAGMDPVFTTLPKDVPKIVDETAQKVAGSAPTPYAKAMALQDYLRSGAFTYSLETPAEEGYDGSGMEVLSAFLETKSGYCVHFSAAMAVMARELGIPSRIAVGYAPGPDNLQVVERDGLTLFGYQASGRDAHAWPELYFEGLGWVPFEPTPSRGSVPDYAEQAPAPAPEPGVPVAPNPTADATPTPTAATTKAAAGQGAAATGVDYGRWLGGTGALLVLVLLLSSPALFRGNVRRRRLDRVRIPAGPGGTGVRRAPQAGEAPEVLAWRELVDTAIDYGYAGDPARTPALHAEHIGDMLGPTEPAGLVLLLHAYEQAAYGAVPAGSTPSGFGTQGSAQQGSAVNPEGREDLAEALETVAARLQARATPWWRLRARWLPASLFRR